MTLDVLLNSLFELISSFGLKLLYAAAVLFAGLKIIRWIKKRLPDFGPLKRLEGGIRSFLISCCAVCLYALLFISVAMIMGIPTTSFIAALASCLAAIGLAMQGSLSNFVGGLMLLMFKPFRAGDYISVPDMSVEGTVTEITVIYTVLRTFDNIEVTIPNGSLTNSVVKNITAADPRRLDLTFRTDPGVPLERTEAIFLDLIRADARILSDPAPAVSVSEVTDSALLYFLRLWVPGAEYWNVKFDLTRAVKLAFDENGIAVPHKQVDVHWRNPHEDPDQR